MFVGFAVDDVGAPPNKPVFPDPVDPNKLLVLLPPNSGPDNAGFVLSSDVAGGFERTGLISAAFGVSWLLGDGFD